MTGASCQRGHWTPDDRGAAGRAPPRTRSPGPGPDWMRRSRSPASRVHALRTLRRRRRGSGRSSRPRARTRGTGAAVERRRRGRRARSRARAAARGWARRRRRARSGSMARSWYVSQASAMPADRHRDGERLEPGRAARTRLAGGGPRSTCRWPPTAAARSQRGRAITAGASWSVAARRRAGRVPCPRRRARRRRPFAAAGAPAPAPRRTR